MKLSELIIQITPIDSMNKVNEMMVIFRHRNTLITSDLFQKVLSITNPELAKEMSEQMILFQKNYKSRPKIKNPPPNTKNKKIKKRKGIGGNFYSDPVLNRQKTLDRMSQHYSTQTLREQGYQYGLSDW